jgi:hypothetical protein
VFAAIPYFQRTAHNGGPARYGDGGGRDRDVARVVSASERFLLKKNVVADVVRALAASAAMALALTRCRLHPSRSRLRRRSSRTA